MDQNRPLDACLHIVHISCKETIQKEDIFSDIVTGRILHMMIVRIMNHKNIKLQKAVLWQGAKLVSHV